MSDALRVPRGEFFTVKLTLGGNGAHEATRDHHIRWIRVYFEPDVGRTVEVASYNLAGHAENHEGGDVPVPIVDTGSIVQCTLAVTAPGTLLIWAYCNRHGFWERSMRIELESMAGVEREGRMEHARERGVSASYFNG